MNSDPDTGERVPRAVQACHELLAWLIPLLDQFPRARRFTLGERLESGLLVAACNRNTSYLQSKMFSTCNQQDQKPELYCATS